MDLDFIQIQRTGGKKKIGSQWSLDLEQNLDLNYQGRKADKKWGFDKVWIWIKAQNCG